MKQIKTYPYENLEIADLPDEIWKPIGGFEQRYEVSSFGRIKTLPRERVLHHGGIQSFQERIRKQKVEIRENRKMNDLLFTLIITLKQDRRVRNYSVGRLVYNAFVADFDLNDKSLYISYRDGDAKNLHYQNLFMTNLSEMRFKSFADGRSESHLSELSKPVSQFDTSGKLIRQFPSMYEAGKITGFHSRGIAQVATGGHFLYKGFCWQLGTNKKLSPLKLPARIETKIINFPLMARVGVKDFPEHIPAVFDLSLASRSGETWLDFPGYEGLYKISNQGRIKALKKTSEGKQIKWYPEKIKCLTPEILTDKDGKTKVGSLLVMLCKNQKKSNFYIARWVYHLFSKPFDIADPYLRVYCKDGDNVNITLENLELRNAAWSINKKS